MVLKTKPTASGLPFLLIGPMRSPKASLSQHYHLIPSTEIPFLSCQPTEAWNSASNPPPHRILKVMRQRWIRKDQTGSLLAPLPYSLVFCFRHVGCEHCSPQAEAEHTFWSELRVPFSQKEGSKATRHMP